jgi:hypothetical protein
VTGVALEQLAYDGEHGGGLRLSGVDRRQPCLSPSLSGAASALELFRLLNRVRSEVGPLRSQIDRAADGRGTAEARLVTRWGDPVSESPRLASLPPFGEMHERVETCAFAPSAQKRAGRAASMARKLAPWPNDGAARDPSASA